MSGSAIAIPRASAGAARQYLNATYHGFLAEDMFKAAASEPDSITPLGLHVSRNSQYTAPGAGHSRRPEKPGPAASSGCRQSSLSGMFDMSSHSDARRGIERRSGRAN